LRKVLPKTSNFFVQDDTFALPATIAPGPYELRIQVIDPQAFLNPMQLALQNQESNGYYPLGMVVIPSAFPSF